MSETLSRAGAAIELSGLSKAYGPTRAVDGVDLNVEAGEFMTFLGPSGSGKTTTLNMIAGFIDPTEGDVRVGGSSVLSTPTHKRDMGMVFQGYALFPHMTVADNVGYPLRQRKVPRQERDRLVAAALETVQLTGYESRRPAELSGGQQQRVAFARSIVYRPAVLLMDEPLGALDKKLRESLQDEIRRIHAEVGTTFVYVTHDQEEALSLSDRIAVYNEGRIEQVGTGEELYESPRTLFVARFIGESTLLRGTVSAEAPGVLQAGDARMEIENPGGLTGPAVLMVRPERLRLAPLGRPGTDAAGSAGPGGHRVEVTVTDEVYLGHARRLTIALPGGGTGTVRETGERSAVRSGDTAIASWDPGAAVLLADTDAGTDAGPPAAASTTADTINA